MRRIAERLVDMALHARVQADHLANGHGSLLIWIKPVDSRGVPLEQRQTPA
jgi:hypothetical protein